MDNVKWIKLFVSARKGKSMKQIKALPDGKSLALFWYEIMQLAGECNENGFLYFEQDFPYTDAMLANEFDYDESFVKYAIQIFKQFKMIEQIDDVYMLSNWDKYQNVQSLENIRIQNAKRQAKYRKKLKELNALENSEVKPINESNVISNVENSLLITQSNAIERRKKKEDIIINNNKNVFVEDNKLNKTIIEFIEFRKKIKSPMTDRAIELLINKLDKVGSTTNEKIEILNRSIMNGWKGIFELPKEIKKGVNQKKDKPVPDWYGDYEKELKDSSINKQATEEEQEELQNLVKDITG